MRQLVSLANFANVSDSSAFDPDEQARSLSAKAAAALDRLGDYTRVRHWEAARAAGLTPLQHKVLLSVCYHGASNAKPSALAAYFGVARPTISEATRLLLKKQLLGKRRSADDGRAFELFITDAGERLLTQASDPLADLRSTFADLPKSELEATYASLYALIDQLERSGALSRQRNCHTCVHFRDRPSVPYCALLKRNLTPPRLRIDCPEHERRDVA